MSDHYYHYWTDEWPLRVYDGGWGRNQRICVKVLDKIVPQRLRYGSYIEPDHARLHLLKLRLLGVHVPRRTLRALHNAQRLLQRMQRNMGVRLQFRTSRGAPSKVHRRLPECWLAVQCGMYWSLDEAYTRVVRADYCKSCWPDGAP